MINNSTIISRNNNIKYKNVNEIKDITFGQNNWITVYHVPDDVTDVNSICFAAVWITPYLGSDAYNYSQCRVFDYKLYVGKIYSNFYRFNRMDTGYVDATFDDQGNVLMRSQWPGPMEDRIASDYSYYFYI